MWLNLINLCGNDLRDLLKGEEKRHASNVLCVANGLSSGEYTINDELIFVIHVVAKNGPDPKIHFKDKEKFEQFYNLLSNAVMCEEGQFFDVLEHGAI